MTVSELKKELSKYLTVTSVKKHPKNKQNSIYETFVIVEYKNCKKEGSIEYFVNKMREADSTGNPINFNVW